MIEHTSKYYSCEFCGCEGSESAISRHERYCSHNPSVIDRFRAYEGKCVVSGNYTYRFSKLTEEGMRVVSVFFDSVRENLIVNTKVWDLEDVERYADDREIPATEYISVLDKAMIKIKEW